MTWVEEAWRTTLGQRLASKARVDAGQIEATVLKGLSGTTGIISRLHVVERGSRRTVRVESAAEFSLAVSTQLRIVQINTFEFVAKVSDVLAHGVADERQALRLYNLVLAVSPVADGCDTKDEHQQDAQHDQAVRAARGRSRPGPAA